MVAGVSLDTGLRPELTPATREEGVHMTPKKELTEEERKIVSALRDEAKRKRLLAVRTR